MLDIKSISEGLVLNEQGIWQSSEKEKVSFPSGGNSSCYAIEDDSFWFKHRNNCITTIAQLYPPKENGTIFDIGGGNGYVSSGLMNVGFNVALLEPGQEGANNAKKRGIQNVMCATMGTAKFKAHSLPAAGLFDVIEHIEDDLQFLQSIHGLLQEDGHLYITVPAYSFLWSDEDIYAGHFKRYTLKSISKVLQEAGFNIEYSSYIFRYLPLPILFSRTLPHLFGFSKDKDIDAKAPKSHSLKNGILNSFIQSVLQSEVTNLQNNKSMMFGGSCLVVAKSQC
jgi:SAM-dependent methyltransferase